MEVQDAIRTAKTVVANLFESEGATNIGLEELEYDDENDAWNVTVGFSRLWDRPSLGVVEAVRVAGAGIDPRPTPRRTYKIVSLAKDDGKLISITNRDV